MAVVDRRRDLYVVTLKDPKQKLVVLCKYGGDKEEQDKNQELILPIL